MRKCRPITALFTLLIASAGVDARPYPGISGIAATADSAKTAGNNPAGITRFSQRAFSGEAIFFTSDSEWESSFSEAGETSSSFDSSDNFVPRVAYVQPINDRLGFGFTFLGASFDDDFGDWAGRYFIESYTSLLVSAYPSLAFKINDQWSIAGSVAISYSSFEQERAVLNLLDPGYGDGKSKIETDSIEFGWGASTLYQLSEKTRFGLTYQSRIEQEQEGDNKYSGLGPNTAARVDALGLNGRDVTVEGTRPESIVLGMYHEFDNNHAVTVDVIYNNFSKFRLSEFFFDGESYARQNEEYNDIYALAASYSFPVSDRWMIGVSSAVTNEMLDDEDRTITLRLDQAWTAGIAAEWQWTDKRKVDMSVTYVGVGDGTVETAELPVLGSLQGKYKSRDIWLFQVSVNWGAL